MYFVASFRASVVNWPGDRGPFSNADGSLHGAQVSSKLKFLRAIRLEFWKGEIHKGNPGVLDIGNWPQTQHTDF